MKPIGVILAGGQSSRMKTSKAAVVVDGVSFFARAVSMLRQCCDTVVVVGDSAGVDVARVDATIADDKTGPLGALDALLRRRLGERYVVCAVDQPLLTVDDIAALLHLAPTSSRCCAFDREPLPMVVSQSADTFVHALLAEGKTRLRDVIDTWVAPPAPTLLRLANFNTPADLERWAMLSGKPSA